MILNKTSEVHKVISSQRHEIILLSAIASLSVCHSDLIGNYSILAKSCAKNERKSRGRKNFIQCHTVSDSANLNGILDGHAGTGTQPARA